MPVAARSAAVRAGQDERRRRLAQRTLRQPRLRVCRYQSRAHLPGRAGQAKVDVSHRRRQAVARRQHLRSHQLATIRTRKFKPLSTASRSDPAKSPTSAKSAPANAGSRPAVCSWPIRSTASCRKSRITFRKSAENGNGQGRQRLPRSKSGQRSREQKQVELNLPRPICPLLCRIRLPQDGPPLIAPPQSASTPTQPKLANHYKVETPAGFVPSRRSTRHTHVSRRPRSAHCPGTQEQPDRVEEQRNEVHRPPYDDATAPYTPICSRIRRPIMLQPIQQLRPALPGKQFGTSAATRVHTSGSLSGHKALTNRQRATGQYARSKLWRPGGRRNRSRCNSRRQQSIRSPPGRDHRTSNATAIQQH